MRPQFADLLVRLGDDDPRQVDQAFDSILFDREQAIPDLISAYRNAFGQRTAALAGGVPLNDRPTVRFLIVQLLGFTGSDSAIETVEYALNDPEAYVRAEACRALADLMATQSRSLLQSRLNDTSLEVRRAASEALEILPAG